MILIIILLVAWDIYWKAPALWIAAHKRDKKSFMTILVISSAGVIPIYYLFKNNYFKINKKF